MIKLKRIYEEKEEADGVRILVDRLWPRGISKDRAKLDYWLKDVAPSNELRKSFHHQMERFPEFKERYLEELKTVEQNSELQNLKEMVKSNPNVTLLYAAKDKEHNQAVVLKEVLEKTSKTDERF